MLRKVSQAGVAEEISTGVILEERRKLERHNVAAFWKVGVEFPPEGKLSAYDQELELRYIDTLKSPETP